MVNYNVEPIENTDDPRVGQIDTESGAVIRWPERDMVGGLIDPKRKSQVSTWTIPGTNGEFFLAYAPGYTGNRLAELMNNVKASIGLFAEPLDVPGDEDATPVVPAQAVNESFPFPSGEFTKAAPDVSQERAAPRFGDEAADVPDEDGVTINPKTRRTGKDRF